MLLLEDGPVLRLAPGIGHFELSPAAPYRLVESPSRFGRVTVALEPVQGKPGWRLEFRRGAGPAPAGVQLPAKLGPRMRFAELTGAKFRQEGSVILVDPETNSWSAMWS